jgi:hypothetical protein
MTAFADASSHGGGVGPVEVRSTRGNVLELYEICVLVYFLLLLYLYPYGMAVTDSVNVRIPDLMALVTLALGAWALLCRGWIWLDRDLYIVAGAFVALEVITPFVGGLGYRQLPDAVSGIRMAMIWLPMIFLTMLAHPTESLRFERRLAKVLAVSLWLNLIYSLVQIAVTLHVLPQSLLVTVWLAPFAVDNQFSVLPGLRPSGFFVATTALSMFGVVCLSFYYARYLTTLARRDLLYSVLAAVLIVLTTSRAAVAAAALIIAAGWLRLPLTRKLAFALVLAMAAGAMLAVIEKTIGLQEAFYRFSRLAQSGLLEDYSFGHRVNVSWPAALRVASNYAFGTLVQSTRALPLIDSGYLTYYLQAKWVFITAIAILLGGLWLLGIRALFGVRGQRIGVIALFLAVYLTGAMIVTNPLRSPPIVFMLVFTFWRAWAARCSLVVAPGHLPDRRGERHV